MLSRSSTCSINTQVGIKDVPTTILLKTEYKIITLSHAFGNSSFFCPGMNLVSNDLKKSISLSVTNMNENAYKIRMLILPE